MKNLDSFGSSRYWWLLLLAGIFLIAGGIAYWVWPAAGFAVASMLFGWILIAVGLVQICVAGARVHPVDWVWWLVGGVINVLIGFLMATNVFLAESVFPYFLAFIFLYYGFMACARGWAGSRHNGRWLYFINGVLMIIIGCCFLGGGYVQKMEMVSFLAALAFIYWGISVCAVAFELRQSERIDQ